MNGANGVLADMGLADGTEPAAAAEVLLGAGDGDAAGNAGGDGWNGKDGVTADCTDVGVRGLRRLPLLPKLPGVPAQ